MPADLTAEPPPRHVFPYRASSAGRFRARVGLGRGNGVGYDHHRHRVRMAWFPRARILSGHLAVWFAFLAAFAPAQGDEAGSPRELYELRERYHAQLGESVAPAVTDFLTRLRSYEHQCGAVGDYEAALWARTRAALLEQSLAQLADPPGSVRLEPAEAALSGQVTLDRNASLLRRWGAAGSRAVWEVRRIAPGNYRVVLTCGVAPPEEARSGNEEQAAGGIVRVRNASILGTTETPPLTAELADTGGWEHFRDVDVGVLAIRSTSAEIAVEAEKPEPLGLMCLRRVTLRPASLDEALIDPIAPDSDPDIPAELAALGRRHVAQLSSALDALRGDYLRGLDAITSSTDADQDALSAARTAAKSFPAIGLPPFTDAGPTDPSPAATDGEPEAGFVLSAMDRLRAIRSGGIAENAAQDFVSRLRPGSAIEWDTQRVGIPAGFYEVFLRARIPETSGGTFELSAGTQSFAGMVSRPATAAPAEAAFQDLSVGALRIGDDTPKIRLTVTEPAGDSATLCDLRALVLRPITEVRARALVARAASRQATPADPPAPAPPRPGTSSPDDYAVLADCAFVRHQENRADSFRIRHGDVELHVRLYGVTAVKVDYGEDGDDLASHRSLFALDGRQPDRRELERYGNRALRQVETLLGQARFTVYTKREDAGGGRIFAWVATPDGPLQEVLARAGLAVAEGEAGAVPAALRPETGTSATAEWLQGIVAEARRSSRGIW